MTFIAIFAALFFGAIAGFGVQLFRAGRKVNRWYPTIVGGWLAGLCGFAALSCLALLAV